MATRTSLHVSHEETFITKHPLLTSILTILLLAIGYGVAGTILYLNKIASISPVFPVNILLSVIAVLVLLKTNSWDQVFLSRPRGGVPSVRIYAPLAAVLAIAAVTSIATTARCRARHRPRRATATVRAALRVRRFGAPHCRRRCR